MSTCHQAHNIPWHTFTEILEKVPLPYERVGATVVNDTCQLQFTPDENGKMFKKIRFFAAKIAAAIEEFSATERSKYVDVEVDKITELYGKESINEWLKEGPLQFISGWESGDEAFNLYRDGYLDTLKELFIQEKASSLLRLARKGFPLERLQFVTYSNFFHYGLGRIKEDCLTLYLHINILTALGTLQQPEHWYLEWRKFLQQEILQSYDGNCMHVHMYREYFQQNPNFENLDELKDLTKKLFRTLYLYDMILRERGAPISWEKEVIKCVGSYFLNYTHKQANLWHQQLQDYENHAKQDC